MPEINVNEQINVAIIGSGPAGVTATVQLKRLGASVKLFEKDEVGGLVRNAFCVENYPGFPNGISGEKLSRLLKKHLSRFAIQPIFENVKLCTFADDKFHILHDSGLTLANTLVIATGTLPKTIDINRIDKCTSHKFSCEITSFRQSTGLRFAIIGGGDAAFDYALTLARNNSVLILNRGEKLKCNKILRNLCDQTPNISYFNNTIVERADPNAQGLWLTCKREGNISNEFFVDYVIFAVGREPNVQLIDGSILENKNDLEEAKRFFLVGDVKNGLYRQTAISVGDGMRAAMEIYDYLQANKLCS